MSLRVQVFADDRLDRCWDAVVAGAPLDLARARPPELDLLREFHALDAAPEPNACFVKRLGQELALAVPAQAHSPLLGTPAPRLGTLKPISARSRRAPAHHRWSAWAATLLLLLGGTVTLWFG